MKKARNEKQTNNYQGLKDFVEAGRVCYVNYGEDYGKMVVIVDIVDTNRVLVDGMKDFPRVIYPLIRLNLTKLRIPLLRGARTGTLTKAAAKFGLDAKWAENKQNQKMKRYSTRNGLNDLERFKVMVARKQKSYALTHAAPKKGAKKPAAKGKGKK